jgi:hypothetical protein
MQIIKDIAKEDEMIIGFRVEGGEQGVGPTDMTAKVYVTDDQGVMDRQGKHGSSLHAEHATDQYGRSR